MLLTETKIQAAPDKWVEVFRAPAGSPPGSLSDNSGPCRQVYILESHKDHVLIWRSPGGADYEAGTGRVIIPQDGSRDIVATLRNGESIKLTMQTDRDAHPRTMRFTFIPD